MHSIAKHALSGSISTRLALFKRKIAIDPTCPICECFEESVEHILFLCPWTQLVWFGSDLSYKVDPRRISTFDRWIEGIIAIPGTSRTECKFLLSLLSFLCWEIWKARCKYIFNGSRPNPRRVINHARDACSEYLAVVSKIDARGNLSPVPHVQRTRWSKPIPNYVKLNLDGSWYPGTMKGSIGIVSRNSSGEWCGGLASPLLCVSSLSAEAAAALCALHLARNKGYLRVIMEADCKVLIDCINGIHGNNSWAILPLIDEIHDVVSSFEEVTWSWVPRSANRAAHAAASIGNRAMELQSWVDRPPLSLVGVLTSDGLPCPPHEAAAV